MDKQEIISLSKQIGTYDISILPYEDCCTLFVPKSPSTNPNLRIVDKIEATMSHLPVWLEKAVEQTETIILHAGEASIRTGQSEDSVMKDDWF